MNDGHPPGWYPDPRIPAAVRWWDGTQWTDRPQPPPLVPVRPGAAAFPTPPAPPPRSRWVGPSYLVGENPLSLIVLLLAAVYILLDVTNISTPFVVFPLLPLTYFAMKRDEQLAWFALAATAGLLVFSVFGGLFGAGL